MQNFIPMDILLPVLLVLVAAGFVQGVTGFGFGLVAMPLLVFFLDFKSVTALVLLLISVTAAITCFQLRQQAGWKMEMSILGGVFLGTGVGVLALISLDESLLRKGLGVVMLFGAFHEFFMADDSGTRLPSWLWGPFSFLGGFLGAVFNMGGPPLVMCIYSQPWSKEVILLQLQRLFLITAGARLVMVAGNGLLTLSVLQWFIIGLLPSLGGWWVGQKILRKMSQKILRKLIYGMIGILGIRFLFFG